MIRALIYISLLFVLSGYSQSNGKMIRAKSKSASSSNPCTTRLLKKTPVFFGLQLGMKSSQVFKNITVSLDQQKSEPLEKNIDLLKFDNIYSRILVNGEEITTRPAFSKNLLSEIRFTWRTSEKWLSVMEFSSALAARLKLSGDWLVEASDAKYAESILNLDERIKEEAAVLVINRSKYTDEYPAVKKSIKLIEWATKRREELLYEPKYERLMECDRFDLYVSLIETNLAMIHVKQHEHYKYNKKAPPQRIIY